jgi:hypothetical protein
MKGISKLYTVVGGIFGSTIAGINAATQLHKIKHDVETNFFTATPPIVLKGIGYGTFWPITVSYLGWACYHKKLQPLTNACVPYGSQFTTPSWDMKELGKRGWS